MIARALTTQEFENAALRLSVGKYRCVAARRRFGCILSIVIARTDDPQRGRPAAGLARSRSGVHRELDEVVDPRKD